MLYNSLNSENKIEEKHPAKTTGKQLKDERYENEN